MKTLILCSALLFSFAVAGRAQNKPADSQDNISGMYTFLQEGEFVQIDMEDGSRVTGYVSRIGDSESDKGAVLDHLIKEGELKGDQIHFKTKALHGIWFEFFGKVETDSSKDPSKDGFRVLKGKLFQYTDDGTDKPRGKSREITMKSFPMDDVVRK